MAISGSQITALGTNLSLLSRISSSPLVLDLSGNGITTQSITAGAQFDINATGQAINTGWVSSAGEGLLVYDPNNGPITSGNQLFGTSTVLPNGQKAANGFAALAALDTNGDGIINSLDAGWSNLKVWVGESTNGAVQGGQLESLDSLGIVQLNLSYASDPTMNNGNIVGMVSSFVTSNGQTHEMADVWFQTSSVQQTNPASSLVTNSIAALTTSQVVSLTTGGQVAALVSAQVSGLTVSQITALSPLQVASQNGTASLQTQVGGLVQAMGQFSQMQSTGSSSSGINLLNTQSTVNSGIMTANLSSIAATLQQFDINGATGATSHVMTAIATSNQLNPLTQNTQSSNSILITGGK